MDNRKRHQDEHRRHRSATIPTQTTHVHDDPRSYTRPHRQESHYNSVLPSPSYQSVPGPSSTRPLHHASRSSSAQYSSSGYHLGTPQPSQPPHISKGHSATPSSSRRVQPDNIDSRSYPLRRAPTTPTPRSSYEHVSSADYLARTSRYPYSSRPLQPSTHTAATITSTQDPHSKRFKDRDKDRDRYRETDKDRDRERSAPDPDRDRYRERYRSEMHPEKDKVAESDRQREPTRPRNEKRIESDSEGLVYPDNTSKASLSAREGYQHSLRESISGHRRHRTEDGTVVAMARRPHAEPSHNPTSNVYMHSTVPQPEAATDSSAPGGGSNPPPAPRVMPVYLPHKPSKSHHERHTSSTTYGAQSGSDTERTSVKHRMERNHSGPAVQRGDAYQSRAVREKQVQEAPMGPREDIKSKSEAKHSSSQNAHHDSRQPAQPQPTPFNTVDIPLITPGFNSSPLPQESRRHVGTIPVLVAGEGPPDRQAHDALYKPQTALRRDELQDPGYPHVSIASVSKPSHGRSQSSDVLQYRPEHPPLDRSRTDPAVSLSHGTHYRPNDLVPPKNISRYPQSVGTTVELHSSQPRSANKTSFSNPQVVSGPRAQRSTSYADHQNDSTKLVTAATPASDPMARAASSQPLPPSPTHKTNSSSPKIGAGHGSLPFAQPHHRSSSIQRSPSTPPAHPAPMNTSQTYTRRAFQPSDPPSRSSLDPPEPHVVAPRMTTQISNGVTVTSSWVVQTAQANVPLKNSQLTREEKYSARTGPHQPADLPAVAHPQLREVLSQDNHYSTQAAPTARLRSASNQSSPQRSPYGTPKDSCVVGTPRRSPDSSPHLSKAATPEQSKVPPFPPPPPGPPQIAVIGATPSSVTQELPHQPEHNSDLLAPSYPAPLRVSRTTSSSREYHTQTQPQTAHSHPVGSTASYQQTPRLSSQPVTPQAPPFSSYGQLSSNAGGQFSPPPLPIPPPRIPGDIVPRDISPTKPSSDPVPLSPAVPLKPTPAAHTSAILPSASPAQLSLPNGYADFYKNNWTGDGIGATPVVATAAYQKAPSPTLPAFSEVPVVASVETRTLPSSSVDSGNGVNQATLGSPYPVPTQGTSAGSHPTYPASRPMRPKVTIEEVPESPLFTNELSSSPWQMHPQSEAPAQSFGTPMHFSSVPPPKTQPSESNAPPRAPPPLKPKDYPVHTSAQHTPPPIPIQSHDPPAPSPSTHHTSVSSRVPLSAPPTQSTFASSHPDPFHRSTSYSAQPRGYQRPTDAQLSAKPSTPSVATTQPIRSIAQQPSITIIQSAALDATSKGRQYAAIPSATAALPHSEKLPTAEIQTKPHLSRPVAPPPNIAQSALLDAASKGKQPAATPTMTIGTPHPQNSPNAAIHAKPYSSRPAVPPVIIPQGPSARAASSTPTAKSTAQDVSIPDDSVRYRGLLSSASRYASAMNPLYPATHHHATSATSNQQSKPTSSISHHRAVSLPTSHPISTSHANSRAPSPRKPSQPLVDSNVASTAPFVSTSSQGNAISRSAKTVELSWSSRNAVAGHQSTPAPSRVHLPSPMSRTFSHESEILKTPSSIAPSMPKTPQMSSASVSQAAPPIRQRQVSTDSKESKKKSGGFLGGLFRTKSGSSRPLESPVAPSQVKTFMGQHKSPIVPPPAVQHSKSSSSTKESKEKNMALATPVPTTHTTANPPTSVSVQPKVKVPNPATIPSALPSREQQKQLSSNVFSPFSFLISKRKRTMSAASLDVCDGNTATNTAVGSPTINQAQHLPPIVPPPVRDPMVATGEWRDRAEAEQQMRKKNRPRPGVTFDVEEDTPDSYPGTIGRQKGARLVRRKSGRGATPEQR